MWRVAVARRQSRCRAKHKNRRVGMPGMRAEDRPLREVGAAMPLDKSGSRASIGKNIGTEEGAGRPRAQAVAIALNTARRAGAAIPAPKKRKPYAIAAAEQIKGRV